MKKIELCEVYTDEEIKKAVAGVIDSKRYVMGGNLQKFEEEFSSFCSAKYGIGVSSGTAAVLLSLLAIDIKKGDEVIVPSFTFIATASPVLFLGGKPVFADIDPDTCCITPEEIEKKITKKTKAIIPVHLFGHPCDMGAILDIAENHDLTVIEDACQAHGALYKGKKVGSIGDIACFSFYPSKNMTVCGDGGMVVTSNEELAERVRLFRDHGRKEKYTHETLGLNFRLSEIHAAIGRQQLKHLSEWTEKRREVAKKYSRLLEGIEGIKIPIEKEWARHVYHLYVIRTKNRDGLMEHLNKKGISTGVHYPIPIHKQTYMEKIGKVTLPVTEKYAREVLSLPAYPSLKDEDIEYISKEILNFIDM